MGAMNAAISRNDPAIFAMSFLADLLRSKQLANFPARKGEGAPQPRQPRR
jgi:hypothetical protein